MQPTLPNGGLLCLTVFLVSFVICFVAARELKAFWKFYVGYLLVAVILIAFIPELTGAEISDDIDARISYLALQVIAIFALLFAAALGTCGVKSAKSVHTA